MERVEKPWGYEIIWAKTDKYVGKILHINSGQKLSLQYHEKKTETIYVKNGILDLYLQDKILTLHEGEVFHIEPNIVHRFSCRDIFEYVELVEVSTPELDDVIRLEDNYGRS
jgi:quercetin dioxygenase-like cupin family protein